MSVRTPKHIWNSNEKIEARLETIFKKYEELFGRSSLPKHKQYWTLCGDMSDGDKINDNSEYCQMLAKKLFVSSQFYGVDNNPEVISKNKKLFPHLNLYANDFLEQMRQHFADEKFDPMIVNCDYTYMPEKAASYTARVLYFLAGKGVKNVMVVCNMMLNNPRRGEGDIEQYTWYQFLDFLKNQPRWKYCEKMWQYVPEHYIYGGNGSKSKTNLCTHIFYKN